MPKLIPLHKIGPAIETLRSIVQTRGYKVGILHHTDIYQAEANFVAYDNGRLVILIHIPIYPNINLMKVFEYQNTPMFLTNQSSQQILIKPEKPILAINNDTNGAQANHQV